jgi:hypothetical protein
MPRLDAAVDSVPDGAIDAPGAALPTAMVVQQVGNYANSTSTLSATLPALPGNGHVLLMIGATPSGALASVTGAGATWTRAASSLTNSNIELWYAVTDGTNATVTINRPNSGAPIFLHVSEWSGLATTGSLDQATVADGTVGPASAGSITTTNALDLVVFAASAYTPSTFGSPAPGTWASLTPISGAAVTQRVWYRIENATGTFAPTVAQSGGFWDALLAAFRLAP